MYIVQLYNVNSQNPKTLDRRPCTGRIQYAVVIFLFGLEALLTRDSRVLSYAASSSPKLQAAIGYYSDQTQFLLAPPVIRPVSNSLLSIFGPLENTALLKCRHPHCVALSFYIMSLVKTPVSPCTQDPKALLNSINFSQSHHPNFCHTDLCMMTLLWGPRTPERVLNLNISANLKRERIGVELIDKNTIFCLFTAEDDQKFS